MQAGESSAEAAGPRCSCRGALRLGKANPYAPQSGLGSAHRTASRRGKARMRLPPSDSPLPEVRRSFLFGLSACACSSCAAASLAAGCSGHDSGSYERRFVKRELQKSAEKVENQPKMIGKGCSCLAPIRVLRCFCRKRRMINVRLDVSIFADNLI